MSCTNCFNGCLEITSDKCVKYTGPNIETLSITTGDPLNVVLQQLTTFLLSSLNGTGIKPIISEDIICEIIQDNLPNCSECDGFNLNQLLEAIILSICSISSDLTNALNDISSLNSTYNLECLTGISNNKDTHEILQATITRLCTLVTSFTNFQSEVAANYVSVEDIDSYISNYINTNPSFNLINSKMIPYVALPYFGSISNFDLSGAGIGNWIKVNLCNGQNGTPDLRGRALVGTTDMGSSPMSNAVNPSIPGNPTYTLGVTQGENNVTLNINQIPNHNHVITINNGGDHFHYTVLKESASTTNANSLFDGTNINRNEQPLCSRAANQSSDAYDYELVSSPGTANSGKTNNSGTHTHTATSSNIGGGTSHNNIQPVIASYFIMYIP